MEGAREGAAFLAPSVGPSTGPDWFYLFVPFWPHLQGHVWGQIENEGDAGLE